MKSLKNQKGNDQNQLIEAEQTTKWPKEKVQKDKQLSKKNITHKAIDPVTQTLLKSGARVAQ